MTRRTALQRLAFVPLLGPVLARIATAPPGEPVWTFTAMLFRHELEELVGPIAGWPLRLMSWPGR